MPVDITKDLKRYIPIFQQSHEQGINEAETSLRIGKFLEDALGYDIFQDITKEHSIKNRYIDYAIKAEGKVVFFVEVKQAGIELREKHIEQAANYAANAGVEWVVLTNGRYWQLYHLTFDEGIQSDIIFSVDLVENDPEDSGSKLSFLHKKSILKGELTEYYERIKTLSPKSLVQAMFHEETLSVIRRNLRRITSVMIDEKEVVDAIKQMISSETWELIGDIKIKRRRKTMRQKEEVSTTLAAPDNPINTPAGDDEVKK